MKNAQIDKYSAYTGEFTMSSNGDEIDLKNKLILKRLEVCLSAEDPSKKKP
jgi:RNA binding exosome subunit